MSARSNVVKPASKWSNMAADGGGRVDRAVSAGDLPHADRQPADGHGRRQREAAGLVATGNEDDFMTASLVFFHLFRRLSAIIL